MIERKISSQLKEQLGSAQYNVDATSYNRRVLLVGDVASEEVKNKVAEIAKNVPNVAGVINELSPTFLHAPAGDAMVTSNVKARLVTNNEGRFSPTHIKVITENSVVYLMGLVTQQEAEAATEVARNSKGVERVVKVFEYIEKTP